MSCPRFTDHGIPRVLWYAVVLVDIQLFSSERSVSITALQMKTLRLKQKLSFISYCFRGYFLWLHIHLPKESCCYPLKPSQWHCTISTLRLQFEEFSARSLLQAALGRKRPLLQGTWITAYPDLFPHCIFNTENSWQLSFVVAAQRISYVGRRASVLCYFMRQRL